MLFTIVATALFFAPIVYFLTAHSNSGPSPGALHHDFQFFSSLGNHSLDDWVAKEEAISWNAILGNINPPGAIRGFVAASLSTFHPDYYYSWTRDSALVMRPFVAKYNNTIDDREAEHFLSNLLREYAAHEIYHQAIPTVCECLGEVKFRWFNFFRIMGETDGPALRASTLILFADSWLGHHGAQGTWYVTDVLRPAIYKDLDYVAGAWGTSCFDLWEEVCGVHFYTLMSIRRALIDGARFAARQGDAPRETRYQQAANQVRTRLETFWSPMNNYIIVTQDYCGGVGKPLGLDISIILAANHASLNDGLFTPGSDKVLATAVALQDAFSTLYPINARQPSHLATAMGRYPEDVYDGYGISEGNPWFLATAAMAELYYRAIDEWSSHKKDILVNEINAAFFVRFDEAAIPGKVYKTETPEFDAVIQGIATAADQFLATVQYHQRANGSLSEQFSRYDGYQAGARDLSWSFASFITAAWARAGRPMA